MGRSNDAPLYVTIGARPRPSADRIASASRHSARSWLGWSSTSWCTTSASSSIVAMPTTKGIASYQPVVSRSKTIGGAEDTGHEQEHEHDARLDVAVRVPGEDLRHRVVLPDRGHAARRRRARARHRVRSRNRRRQPGVSGTKQKLLRSRQDCGDVRYAMVGRCIRPVAGVSRIRRVGIRAGNPSFYTI